MTARTFILHGESQYKAMTAYIALNWQACADNGKPLAVTVAEYKDKRNLQQNRLYWAFLHQIEEQAMIERRRYSDECWHDYFRGKFIGFEDMPDGSKRPMSTTKLSVSEFADYVTKVTVYAVELGVIFEQ